MFWVCIRIRVCVGLGCNAGAHREWNRPCKLLHRLEALRFQGLWVQENTGIFENVVENGR